MIYKDAALIGRRVGKYEGDKALIRAVSRNHGFFELLGREERWTRDSAYVSANELAEMMCSSKGGIVIVSSEHRDFEALMSHADIVWSDGKLYEFEIFGRKAGFCIECRGELEEGNDWQTCDACQRAIIEDLGIEPRPLAKAFVERMTAWHERHGDYEAIERLKALA